MEQLETNEGSAEDVQPIERIKQAPSAKDAAVVFAEKPLPQTSFMGGFPTGNLTKPDMRQPWRKKGR